MATRKRGACPDAGTIVEHHRAGKIQHLELKSRPQKPNHVSNGPQSALCSSDVNRAGVQVSRNSSVLDGSQAQAGKFSVGSFTPTKSSAAKTLPQQPIPTVARQNRTLLPALPDFIPVNKTAQILANGNQNKGVPLRPGQGVRFSVRPINSVRQIHPAVHHTSSPAPRHSAAVGRINPGIVTVRQKALSNESLSVGSHVNTVQRKSPSPAPAQGTNQLAQTPRASHSPTSVEIVDLTGVKDDDCAMDITDEIIVPTASSSLHCSTDRPILSTEALIAVDTNIFIRDLQYIKWIQTCTSRVFRSMLVVVPWSVLQELDKFKQQTNRNGNSLESEARAAIRFINRCLVSNQTTLIVQTPQDEKTSLQLMETRNTDDRILCCSLQWQQILQRHGCGENIFLLSNDINLRNKALALKISSHSTDSMDAALGITTPKPPYLSISSNHTTSAPVNRTSTYTQASTVWPHNSIATSTPLTPRMNFSTLYRPVSSKASQPVNSQQYPRLPAACTSSSLAIRPDLMPLYKSVIASATNPAVSQNEASTAIVYSQANLPASMRCVAPSADKMSVSLSGTLPSVSSYYTAAVSQATVMASRSLRSVSPPPMDVHPAQNSQSPVQRAASPLLCTPRPGSSMPVPSQRNTAYVVPSPRSVASPPTTSNMALLAHVQKSVSPGQQPVTLTPSKPSQARVKEFWDLLESQVVAYLGETLIDELKKAYGNLWEKIVLHKPPWTMLQILECYEKHWIAVLQFILEKRHQNLVTDLLISFRGKKKLKGVPPTVGQMSSILNNIETIATYLSQSAISEKDDHAGRSIKARAWLVQLKQKLLDLDKTSDDNLLVNNSPTQAATASSDVSVSTSPGVSASSPTVVQPPVSTATVQCTATRASVTAPQPDGDARAVEESMDVTSVGTVATVSDSGNVSCASASDDTLARVHTAVVDIFQAAWMAIQNWRNVEHTEIFPQFRDVVMKLGICYERMLHVDIDNLQQSAPVFVDLCMGLDQFSALLGNLWPPLPAESLMLFVSIPSNRDLLVAGYHQLIELTQGLQP